MQPHYRVKHGQKNPAVARVGPILLVVTNLKGRPRSMFLCHLKGRMPLSISD